MHSSLRCLSGALLLASAPCAQDPTRVTGSDTVGVPVAPEPPVEGFVPDVGAPPRALASRAIPHATPPVPAGPFRAEPDTPPAVDIEPWQQPTEAGNFTYFQKEPVVADGQFRTVVGEPSVALVRDTVFQTGNVHAVRSIDNGQTWELVSPYTMFPSADGGAAGDQRVYYVESHDITVWILQYRYSDTTLQGSHRISVANGREGLRDPSPSAWTSYLFNPSMMGFPPGHWLDFPDCAVTNGNFHVSANVFAADGAFAGAVRWKLSLDDLAANTAVDWSYATSTTMGGLTYRFAEGGTNGNRLFYAAIKSTSEVYVYFIRDNGNWTRMTRDVATFSTDVATCPGPDGRDWCQSVTGRFRGTFGNDTEVGFMLTSAARGSRPLPYTRVMRFTADNSMTLIAEHDIYSETRAFAYATGRSNANGDIGIVLAAGGSNSYVHGMATIIDSYQPWGTGLTLHSMGAGTSGPYLNRWGDYFDVHRHPDSPNTFYATGMRQVGGSTDRDNEPQFVWFGRDDHEPDWVYLEVESTPISGVPITQNVAGLNGNRDGVTGYRRRFAPGQGYRLEAPLTVNRDGTVYAFDRWLHQGVPGGPYTGGLTRGDTVLEIDDMGTQDDLVEARYAVRRTLSVRSNETSVEIAVSPSDIHGDGTGKTDFARHYTDGTVVSLTAQTAVGVNPFRHWRIGGAPRPDGQRTVDVTLAQDTLATAVYWENVPGAVNSLGAGCRGAASPVPVHTIVTDPSGPQQGKKALYQLANAAPGTLAQVHFGLRTDRWGGFKLPLDLDFLGMTTCRLHHDLVINQSVQTSAAGTASVAVIWPSVPSAIGARIYSTYLVVDRGANPLGVLLSNSLESVLGGLR